MNEPRTLPVLTAGLLAHFWARVDKRSAAQCWQWTGGKCNGYGILRIGKRVCRAQRIAYAAHNPTWNQRTNVLHTCDNPSCCNPAHLYAGTQADNASDRESRGRGQRPDVRGSKHGSSTILVERDILDIRLAHSRGASQISIAARYGVGQWQISKIINSKAWKHVAESAVSSAM